MTNEHYDLVKIPNDLSYSRTLREMGYELQENGKAIGKLLVVRPKNDKEFPNEIEVLKNYTWGWTLKSDANTLDEILATMRISKELVGKVESKGKSISYDPGGA